MTFEKGDHKWKILSNSGKLRSTNAFSKVNLSTDKTEKEKQTDRKLKTELENKKRLTGLDYTIFANEIMLRTDIPQFKKDREIKRDMERTRKRDAEAQEGQQWLNSRNTASPTNPNPLSNPQIENELHFGFEHKVEKHLGFRCLYTNTDCLHNKLDEIEIFSRENKIDLIAITETLPKHDAPDKTNIKFSLEGYEVLQNNYGRGVCIFL